MHALSIQRFFVRVKRYLVFISFYIYYMMASVIRQKGESQNGGNKKAKYAKFSEKRTCAYQGVRNVRFLETLACFAFLLPLFWDLPFCLITNKDKLYIPAITVQCKTLSKSYSVSSLPLCDSAVDIVSSYLIMFSYMSSRYSSATLSWLV